MKPWALLGMIPILVIPGCPDSGTPARYDVRVDASLDGTAEAEAPVPGLCERCTTDSECVRGSCLTFGGGHYCVPACEYDSACPPFFRCLPVSGEALRYCIPLTKTCTCTFLNAGESVTCERSNPFGSCKGQSVCDPKTGWTCLAPVPAAETCNGLDDDCDGATDEDFTIAGQYVHDAHCGACGASCLVGFDNGVGRCSVESGTPTCVLSACNVGYLPLDGKCVPASGKLCTPCATDADCGGGKCRVLPAEGGVCVSSCKDSPCPSGYVCQPADAIPDAWCMPATGSCACGPDTIGLTRTCAIQNAAGTCFGLETCTALGFVGCTAKAPSVEICNGLDEDCDGFTDEDLVATKCTSTVSGLDSCEGMQKCDGANGWVCDAPMPVPETCNFQDDDCDGIADDGFKDPGSGIYFLDSDCGTCGNDCAEHDPRPNAVFRCSVMAKEAACRMVCKEGFVDVNKLEDDGCECEFQDPTDPPDGIDQNCDGVDGEPDKAVFVAEYGKDTNPGTIDKPFRSLQKGLETAAAKGLPYVYVGAGSYWGPVSLRNGIEVYGGFNQGFSACKPDLFESRISMEACQADNAGTVNAIGVGGVGPYRTVLSGFTVEGPDCTGPGQSSYAIYVRDCEGQLVIMKNRIRGGRGGPGGAGLDGGKGADGVVGTDGKPAVDSGMPGCLQKLAPAGGTGGKSSCDGVPVHGGDGGTAACPDYDEYSGPDSCGSSGFQTPKEFEYGKAGLPSGLGGAGGSAGQDSLISTHFSDPITGECSTPTWACAACQLSGTATDASRGENGKAGPAGSGGQGCADTLGSVSAGYWHGPTGKTGAQGGPGGGGGGGGAGGGVETDPGCSKMPYFSLGFSDFGGSGGGGGSGGCGGLGGGGGEAGGGSFAVFMTFNNSPIAIPAVVDNRIITGYGGAGGKGGAGGLGGFGGYGGKGGEGGNNEQTWCARAGRDGGNGGQGGFGGGGGGGCGGPAIGLFVSGVKILDPTVFLEPANQFVLEGSGGAGGPGGKLQYPGAPEGGKGADGAHKKTNL